MADNHYENLELSLGSQLHQRLQTFTNRCFRCFFENSLFNTIIISKLWTLTD